MALDETTRDALLDQRRAVRDAAVAMAQHGLATGSSGNISVRAGSGLLITASGIPYDWIGIEHIIETDMEGHRLSGDGDPSSEWRMHAAIYARRLDVAAIVHTHSLHATAAAIALRELPIPHDEGRLFYGDAVPVSEHHPPGSWDLARSVADALGPGKLVLISHHGAVGVGATLDEAFTAAVKLEEIATLCLLSHQLRTFVEGRSDDE